MTCHFAIQIAARSLSGHNHVSFVLFVFVLFCASLCVCEIDLFSCKDELASLQRGISGWSEVSRPGRESMWAPQSKVLSCFVQ